MAKRSKRKAPAAVAPAERLMPDISLGFPAWLGTAWAGGIALVLLVIAVYLPMWWALYIWDDDLVLTQNPVITGPKGFLDIWTSPAADICPLTISTFWLEHEFWGFTPWPYHIVNVTFHVGCAVVLWRVLLLLRIPGAWIGAALWAVHPVMVESVAWITEMKNTESGLFYLLTILFFLRTLPQVEGYEAKRWPWNYGLCLLMAALAIASKSSTVVLPIVLCLMAWWVERGWRWTHVLRVSPMLVLAAAAAAVSIWTQKIAGAYDAVLDRSWPERFVDAADIFWFYIGKLVWPNPLVMLYPKWEINLSDGTAYLPLVALVLVAVVLWWWRNSWARPWFFAMAYFGIVLLPVMGFVNMKFFFYTMVADHFQYLAAMGPLALVGAGIWQFGLLVGMWSRIAAAGIVLAVLSIVCVHLEPYYHDEHALWEYELTQNPQCAVAHNNLGMLMVKSNRVRDSIPYFEKALLVDPKYQNAETNLGSAYYTLEDTDRAIVHYKTAIDLKPTDAHAYANMGIALTKQGHAADAIPFLAKAVALEPDDAGIRFAYGLCFVQLKQLDKACEQFQWAIRIDPRDAKYHNNYGAALYHTGDSAGALEQFQEALRRDPDYEDARHNVDILSKAMQGASHP